MDKEESSVIEKWPLPLRLAAVLVISAVNFFPVVYMLFRWKSAGVLIPSDHASLDLTARIIQDVKTLLVPVAILIVFFLILKKNFFTEMYLKVKGKKQWIPISVVIVLMLGTAAYSLITKEDKVSALYCLFYYTFVIAFSEEIICRGVCTYCLKNDKTAVRYLVPNLIFALLYIFSLSGWGNITGPFLFDFFKNYVPVTLGVGCLFQLAKEKSGTIWLPVLIHACYNYMLSVNGM